MSLMSALKNVVTGEGRPNVIGTMATEEIKRLDALLKDVPAEREWRDFREAGIHKISGIYRGPNYVLEGIRCSRLMASGLESFQLNEDGAISVKIREKDPTSPDGLKPAHEIDIRSVEIGELVTRVLTAVLTRAHFQRIGGND